MDQPISVCIGLVKNITNTLNREDKESMFFLVVFNAVLAIPTAAANALVILAILTTSSLRTPSYLLLTSLAFSDLAVGVAGHPIFAFCISSFQNRNTKAYCYARWVLSIFLGLAACVTIFTVVAISVDRYLAIRLKMRYRSVVTVRRVRFILMSVWIHSMFGACCPLFISLITCCIVAACELVICLTVIVVFYTMSFRALKIHCAQTQPQGNQQQPNSTTQSNAIDVLKYRKLLKTMILILGLIIVFYLPLLGVFIELSDPNLNRLVVWSLLTITSLNSLFNPVIYMTRMNDLRRICFQMLAKLFHLS